MTAERNTIFHLVSDVEDEICNLEGYASLMQLAADGVASHHSRQAGDGLIRLAAETNDCVERLREWFRTAHAAVGGQDNPEPVKPAAPDEPVSGKVTTVGPVPRLYHQWQIIRAQLDLDLIQTPGSNQARIDHLMQTAHKDYAAIEEEILAKKPDTLTDHDLVCMLRLAQQVIGCDDFTDEQEERCKKMMELVDVALVMRVPPDHWRLMS